MRTLIYLILVTFACLTATLPRSAAAHDIVVASTPPAGGTVDGRDLAITIQYSGRVDHARSQLSLVRSDGSQQALELSESPRPNVLAARPISLDPGAYIVLWVVLSSDGHIMRGEIPFSVKGQ